MPNVVMCFLPTDRSCHQSGKFQSHIEQITSQQKFSYRGFSVLLPITCLGKSERHLRQCSLHVPSIGFFYFNIQSGISTAVDVEHSQFFSAIRKSLLVNLATSLRSTITVYIFVHHQHHGAFRQIFQRGHCRAYQDQARYLPTQS